MTRAVVALVLLVVVCAACAAAPSKQPDHSTVQRELRDILSAPEYNHSYAPDLTARVLNAITKAIDRFFRWLGGLLSFGMGGGAAKTLSFILAWAVVVAFVGLLALLISRLASGTGRRDRVPREIDDYELPSSGPLIREAERLARAGDYRGAFRCAYLASISHLDEVKAVRFERSRTNWEYLRDLETKGMDAQRGELLPITRDFDRKFYGRESCGEPDYQVALRVYERISEVKAA